MALRSIASLAAVPSVAWLAAGLSALLVAVPSMTIAWRRGFDGLYGQDAYAYYDYAVHSVRQSILQVRPLEAFFWPPGYPLLVALTSFVAGVQPLAGQLVSLVAGAAVPLLTALLARELMPEQRWVPLLCGVVAAASGQLWQSSIVVMSDTTGLALATLSALAVTRYARRPHAGWLVLAAAAIGYATLTRWIYGLVALVFALAALGTVIRERRLLDGLAASAVGGLIVLPLLGPPALAALVHPGAPAAFAGNLEVYSWSPLNAVRRDFFTVDGHLSYAVLNGVYYAIAPANLAYFGPLIAPWALIGAWRAWRCWRRSDVVLIVGWALVVFTFHAGAPWQNFRFTLAYLPPLAVLVGVGLACAFAARPTWVRALALICTLSLVLTLLNGVRLLRGFIDRKDDELALVHWVEPQVASGGQLFSFGPTLAFRQYTALPTYDLFDLSQAELSRDVDESPASYVLVDETNIAEQWPDAAPGQNLAALRATRSLVELGSHGTYTLYRLEPERSSLGAYMPYRLDPELSELASGAP
jgi:hypothetical protein